MKLEHRVGARLGALALWAVLGLGAGAAPGQAADPGRLVTMDFQEVELGQVVRFVAEMTGRNFVVSDQMKTRVTVVTPTPVTPEEAYQLFQSMLQVHGFAVVEVGETRKVVPVAAVRSEGTEVSIGSDGPRGGEVTVTRLLRPRNIDAATLATTLKPLVHGWGVVAAYPPSNSLIITDSAATVRKIVAMVNELDVPDTVAVRRLLPLTYASAARIEKLIGSIYADFNARQPQAAAGVKVFADDRTNTLLVLAPAERMGEIGALVSELDRRLDSSSGNLHLYYPKNAKASAIANVLNELLGKLGGGQEGAQAVTFSREVSIVGEESTNALVISATEDDYDVLLPIIEGLDIRRLQVYVEGLILEINATRATEFGIEWRVPEDFSANVGNASVQPFGGTSFGGVSALATNPLAPPQGLSLGIVKGTISFGGQTFLNLAALIRALQTDSDANILATPNLLTMDNEEAEIIVGQNIPIRTGTQSTSAGSTLQSIERQNVGLTLRVVPQIVEGGRLLLEIFQEQSSLADAITIGSNETDVVTNKRSIRTTVLLASGEMVTLGGLITENVSQNVAEVPCLGGVSGVGELFKSTDRSRAKNNLMVFLRPTIINTYEDLLDISREKYRSLRERWGKRENPGTVLLPADEAEPLPPEPLDGGAVPAEQGPRPAP